MKRAEMEARKRGHLTLLPLAIKVWEGILRGTIPASAAVRVRVSNTVADRFGLPRKTELQVDLDLTAKYVELGGWRDEQGEWHDEPVQADVVILPADADVDGDAKPVSPNGHTNGTNGHGRDDRTDDDE